MAYMDVAINILCRFLGFIILLSLFCISNFSPKTAGAESNPLPGPSDGNNYDVRRFLEEAPPLARIVYGEDASSYGINGQTLQGFVFHQAAWQPPSFYILNLTNSPGIKKSSQLYSMVIGQSLDGKPWLLNRSGTRDVLWLSSIDNTDTERASAVQAVRNGVLRMQNARGLWLHLLRPGSLRWVSTNRFEAKADIPVEVKAPHDPECTLSGQIVQTDSQGRPLRIEYRCFGFKTLGDMSLDFYYTLPVGNTALPNIIVSSIDFFSGSGKHTLLTTNLLNDLVIGPDDTMGTNGYVPGLFLSSKAPPVVIVSSNGVDFRFEDHKFKRLDAPPPLKAGNSLTARAIMISLLFLTLPCLWMAWKKKK